MLYPKICKYIYIYIYFFIYFIYGMKYVLTIITYIERSYKFLVH